MVAAIGRTSDAPASALAAGPWQTPGTFHTPSGPWQSPGAIQVPKGIQAIKQSQSTCADHFAVSADALFAFDSSALSSDADKTLTVLGPLIAKQAAHHPVVVNGYTDAIGSDGYNLALSDRRAQAVRDWLAARAYLPNSTAIKGYGKADPVAPNANPDGSDDPQGRAKNRRVDVVVDTCH